MKQFGEKREGYKYTNRPGAYAIIFDGKKQIAVVETPTGFFLPGGGIEKGESPEQALKREIQEEIGMSTHIVRQVGEAAQYLYSRLEKKAFNKTGTFFLAELVGAPTEPSEKEHTLRWFSSEKTLKKLNHEFQRFMVEQVLQEK